MSHIRKSSAGQGRDMPADSNGTHEPDLKKLPRRFIVK
jgi:hypothetical protein